MQVDESYKFSTGESAYTRTAHEMNPREPLVTGVALFDMVVHRLIRRANIDEESGEALTLAILTLYTSLAMRLCEKFVSHSGHLLKKIHQTQLDERARIARELHDRAGFWLNTAYRQIELYGMDRERESTQTSTAERLETARAAVRETIRSLREVTSELRLHEPLKDLETALLTAFAALSADDVSLRLNINGDEAWAPAAVKDETFLIVREAVRNAVVHGRPKLIVVSVHIASHELRVYVDDDGCGFDPAPGATSGGTGLLTMRERAELLNGMLTISSTPGRGTHVDLYIRLSGGEDD